MKTIFISETTESSNPDFLFQCPYIKFIHGKLREDVFYFNNKKQLLKSKKGYLIKWTQKNLLIQ